MRKKKRVLGMMLCIILWSQMLMIDANAAESKIDNAEGSTVESTIVNSTETAAEGTILKTINFPAKSFVVSSNGGSATLKNKKNDTTLTFSTEGLANGYYTAFVSQEKGFRLVKSNIFSLSLSCDYSVSMNLNLIAPDGSAYVINNEETVLVKTKESSVFELLQVKDGSFLLPEGFDGELFIPANRFESNESNFGLLGFVFTQPENQISNVTIDEVKLSDSMELSQILDSNLSFMANHNFSAIGDTYIEIPAAGEFQYQYGINDSNGLSDLTVNYQLDNTYTGITISEDGLLSVTNEATPKEIELIATINETAAYRYKITVVNPWFAEKEESLKDQFSIPLEVNTSSWYSANVMPRCVDVLRIGAVLVFAGYLVWYIKMKRKS